MCSIKIYDKYYKRDAPCKSNNWQTFVEIDEIKDIDYIIKFEEDVNFNIYYCMKYF